MKYDHTEKAVSFFTQGYNCAQSVFVAFSDVTGMDEELAKRLSSSFGGGMGRISIYIETEKHTLRRLCVKVFLSVVQIQRKIANLSIFWNYFPSLIAGRTVDRAH